MSRRKRAGAADAVIELVALMPWWAGVVLGLVAYVVLHRVAIREVSAVGQTGQLATVVAQSMWKIAATLGQYLVPLLCFAGSGMSAWRRRERRSLLSQASGREDAAVVDGMTWQQFEMLIGEAFRQQGYRVVETGGGGADGGVDLVLTRGNEKSLVQCKQWRAFKVGVETVRELYGVMAATGAATGFVVTSGRFTNDAREFAQGRNVRLIDGTQLPLLLKTARASVTTEDKPLSTEAASDTSSSKPLGCPRCGKPMVKRKAKQGARAGAEFWGCMAYPECRGTRSLD